MNRFFKWGILITLLVMVGCGVMAMRIIFVPRQNVVVPSLVGESAVEAAGRLEALGLTAQVDQVESDKPDGHVISQNMDPGQRTSKGRKIILKVSKGGKQVQIPDVRGTEFAVAVKELDLAGFKVGTVLKVSDQLNSPGTVIAQNPAYPAVVPGNRMVDLLISEGKTGSSEMVQVPDLQGQTEEFAKQVLTQTDLTFARVLLVRSDSVPEGSIVRTSPRAGARVPSGQAVTIYIAQAVPSADMPPPPVVEPVRPTVPPSEPSVAANPANQQDAPPSEAPAPPSPAPAASVVTQPEAGARKVAKVRYQVPPLSRPLSLKIEIADQNGSRVLKEGPAKSGEYLTFDTAYTGTASVEIRLGDELVWQEKYQ